MVVFSIINLYPSYVVLLSRATSSFTHSKELSDASNLSCRLVLVFFVGNHDNVSFSYL
jgi:hypothetical protein